MEEKAFSRLLGIIVVVFLSGYGIGSMMLDIGF